MKTIVPALFFFFLAQFLIAQQNNLNFDDYVEFINNHRDMETGELIQMYPSVLFNKAVQINVKNSLFYDSVSIKYDLTGYELSLLNKHGFVVSERLRENDFGRHFSNIYHKDLPVFISTDAILHPFHVSYDRILKKLEVKFIIPNLKNLLIQMHNGIDDLETKYSSVPEMQKYLKDVDLYLTVPLKLLKIENAQPYYSSNITQVDDLLNDIENFSVVTKPLFTDSTARIIDFSQFKPRGHYTDENYPELEDYFKAMMWLGRIEFYLMKPQADNPPSDDEIKRQTIDAILIKELLNLNNNNLVYSNIENIIKSFMGEQDNVTVDNLQEVLTEVNISSASELLSDSVFQAFQDDLETKSFADQKILSHILFSNPTDTENVKPASAFLLFGQRFVIDSYITANVVFDKIKYNNATILRMLPDALDMLFPLGNNAALQLLKPELDKYHYSTNLAALRYLVDTFDPTFWYGSIYTAWLDAIRKLNPPDDISGLPQFMQTAAWWQEKMNTQLAAWSQLRHDNLLYAKQSYSASYICSFPYGYVEPVPELYKALGTACDLLKEKLVQFDFEDKTSITGFLTFFNNVTDTFFAIANKELNRVEFSDGEKTFLKRLIYSNPDHMCGTADYLGWYPKLFYDSFDLGDGFYKTDFVVADYHTAPTDENGEMRGWVKHAGTGPVDLAFVTAKLPDGKTVTFTGPVLSFHEITTANFFRINDEEWKQVYLSQSTRPDWVNIYLADSTGNSRGEGPQLLTGIKDERKQVEKNFIIARNYPNPFNPSTTISFTIPSGLDYERTTVVVYDVNGKQIKKLLDEKLHSGTYLIKWNGVNNKNLKVSSGVYFYEIKAGAQKFVGKMNLIK